MINYKLSTSKEKKQNTITAVAIVILEDYSLIFERRFARPIDPESHAGGSVSCW
jgi:hypothetical protein